MVACCDSDRLGTGSLGRVSYRSDLTTGPLSQASMGSSNSGWPSQASDQAWA